MESLRRKPILLLLCCLLALGFASMVLADEGEPVLGKMKTPQTAVPTPAHAFAVPANDECTGALLIPDGATGAADYPVCSPITTSVLEATPPYDTPSATDPASCLATGQFVSNTVWYTWTPTVSQYYMLFMCSGSSCRSQTTRTTPSDSVLSLYSSTGGCGGPFTLLDCNDDGCGAAGPSRIGPFLATAGTTYYLAAGNWSNGTASAGAVNQVEIRIEVATPPPNDNCTGAEALQLNTPVPGVMNALTNNDFQLSGTACYNQGQIGTTAANQVPAIGRDVVYSFTPPADGIYSFRAIDIVDSSAVSAVPTVLYLMDSCPVGAPASVTTPPCIYATNRNSDNLAAPTGGAEEIKCVELTGGQTYYVVVDTTVFLSGIVNATFNIAVTQCVDEMELNNTPAGANDPQGTGPNSLFGGCPVEGSIYTPGDVDFWWMGQQNAGDRLFIQADGNGANPSSSSASGVNFDMRITTATDTLEYDDANNNSRFGGLCPNIAGLPLPGATTYARVNLSSATATGEPYRLFSTVRPSGTGPLGTSAQQEPPEPNDADLIVGDYWYGTAGNINGDGVSDIDFYYFCAQKGDQVFVSVDADPMRDNTPFYTGLFVFSATGTQLYGLADTFAQGGTSSTVITSGNLAATTPFSPAQAINVIAGNTGLWAIAVNGQAPATGQPPSVGDYLAQMSLNCAVPAADLELIKTGPADVVAGQNVVYNVTVINHGPNAAAYPAFFADLIPAGTELVDFTAPDGWDCFYAAGELDCIETATGCFTGTAEFTITVNVPQCFGPGVIENLAIAGSNTGDPDQSNNLGAWSVNVLDDGTCNDGDACTTNDYCVAGACVGGPALDCNDNNTCTDDACDPAIGCVYTPNTGAPCTDGNICTGDANGVDMCMDGVCTPGGANTNPCNDGNACTTNDTCGGGVCVGGAPPNCNDGNACSDDTCDPMIGCVNTCNHSCDGNQKGYGYWKRLCRGPHPSGEFISMVDVDCVNNTCTFGSVASPADICAELNQFTHSDKCEQAEAHFMTLLLNTCRCRVSANQMIDSQCGGNNVVGQIVPAIDALLCDPARDHSSCVSAICSSNQINSGEALWANSLRVDRSGSAVKLTWTAPYASPDGLSGVQQPTSYRIYRRTQSEAAMVQVGQVSGSTTLFIDNTATGDTLQYEVTAVW